MTERGGVHTYERGEIEGGDEEDQQASLYRHGNLVGELIHDHSIEESASAVEHRGDCSNNSKELIIKYECLAKCLVEPGHYLRDEDN